MIEKLVKKTKRGIGKILSLSQKRKIPQEKAKKRTEPTSLSDQQSSEIKEKVQEASPLQTAQQSGKREQKPRKPRWKPENFEVPPLPEKTRFHDLGLPVNVMHGIADLDFKYCTPIQAESLPHLLEGKDLIGNANTGTGKSAVFLITLLTRIQRDKELRAVKGLKGLVLAPTRELVIQIGKDAKQLAKYCNIKIVPVYGGADYQIQQEQLEKGNCDIVVATPGRLIDFAGRGVVDLKSAKVLVIDEADRMLDMGFIPDVRRIIHRLPDRVGRQTLMFSATITEDVKRLASQWCRNPVNVSIEPEQVAVDTVEQVIYTVTTDEKYTVLYNVLKKNPEGRVAVFANQKVEARKLSERLARNGIDCVLLSGDVPQKKRIARLERFRSGKTRVLVATDVAGRGIHIEGITHVINYSLPYEPEDYVHRIGRTGRAGADGISIGFACEEGGFVLPDIEKFIGRKLTCVLPEEELLVPPPKGTVEPSPSEKPQRPRRRRRPKQSGGQRSSKS